MAESALRKRFNPGDQILSDFDPKTGRVIKWEAAAATARVRLDPDENVVERSKKCLLHQGRDGQPIAEFRNGHMLCKVAKYPLEGHADHPRRGSIYMATWYYTYSTAYQGMATGGRRDHNIYCIVIDGKVVFRPRERPEVTTKAPETGGEVLASERCILT